ncbi:putative hydrolase C777.06c isoform X1 [Curcuma longa]|uniref:putative hydrolase C777.06c isoform X1 n=1 Tax=Curcuma longa TaxID=136217 RepID=UPI003D9EA179
MGSSIGFGGGVLGDGGGSEIVAGRSSLIFLGTGCSATVPNARCLICATDPPCPVCTQALSIPPESNPNYRCNTSLLIDYCQDGVHNYIIIDVGKTFREQVLRWFTHHKIPRIDSIILTHEHADAVLGLDDVRVVQHDTNSIPIYCTQFTMDSVTKRFPYLAKRNLKEGHVFRFTSQLDWKIIDDDIEKPFIASGLKFIPLPVMHGEDYVCLGFLFGQKTRIAYISDVSRFPYATEYIISKSGAGQLDLLILETNSIRKVVTRSTHLSFPETLETLKRLRPRQALLVGMTHDYDHDRYNKLLEEWSSREGISVQLARDGLQLYADL